MGHSCGCHAPQKIDTTLPETPCPVKSNEQLQESNSQSDPLQVDDQLENLHYVVSELISESVIQQEYFIISKAEEAQNEKAKLQNTKITWKKGELLKKTSNSNTYQGFNLKNGQIIIIKSLRIIKSSFHSEINVITEKLSRLRQLEEDYIVTYYDPEIRDVEQKIYLLQEYVPAGSIKNLLEKFGNFDEKLIKIYARQILKGIEYIHSKGIVHGNLKCSNILVDINAKIKFTDFLFFTANLLKKNPDKDLKEKDAWSSPEFLKERKLEAPSDIWSFGCILIEMFTGESPNPKLIKNYINKEFTQTHSELYNSFFNKISTNLRSFLEKIFKINPLDRPTVSALLQDKFVLSSPKMPKEMESLYEEVSKGISKIGQSRISLIHINNDMSKRISKFKTSSFVKDENDLEKKRKEEIRKKFEDQISEIVEQIKKMLYNSSEM